MNLDPYQPSADGSARHFHTTHWSVVLLAAEEPSPRSQEALETLCRRYWHALYSYVRRRGYGVEEAKDLTQEFFSRLLEKQALQAADPDRGRFRSFLLSSLNHLLTNEWKRARTQRRGGAYLHFSLDVELAEQRYQLQAAGNLSPDRLYDRGWAQALLDQAVERLQVEWDTRPGVQRFEDLKEFLLSSRGAGSLGVAAGHLDIPITTLKSAVQRLRKRFREIFREEIAHTVADPSEVEGEMRYLFTALGD